MKCISLWEPWATLMALGAKTIETRSWETLYRGPLAIQASKRFTGEQAMLMRTEPFAAHFPDPSIVTETLGKIVCIVDLVGCKRTEDLVRTELPPFEIYAGDFGVRRFGWVTRDHRRLKRPIPIIGKQGLFNVDLVYCDSCDGTGLMEGWNRRDGHPCPTCWGDCVVLR